MNPQGMHGMMQAPMQQPVLFCPVQPIYMLHYAAFQDQHKTALACEEPALKKRRQQPRRQCEETLSTVSIPCTYEDLSDESSTEQNGEVPMKGSVAATVDNYRKRNTRPEDIIDLFFPPLTSPISQATHSRPTPRTHVSLISSTPRPTPDMPPRPMRPARTQFSHPTSAAE